MPLKARRLSSSLFLAAAFKSETITVAIIGRAIPIYNKKYRKEAKGKNSEKCNIAIAIKKNTILLL